MKIIITNTFFFILTLIKQPVYCQNISYCEGFEITYQFKDSLFQIGDKLQGTLIFKNISTIPKKFHLDSRISIVKFQNDSEQVLMEPNLRLVPLVNKNMQNSWWGCGGPIKYSKQELKELKNRYNGFSEVAPNDGFISDFNVEEYYYDKELDVFYDFGGSLGIRALKTMKSGKYKVTLNAILGKSKTEFTKEIKFKVVEPNDKNEFDDFVKSMNYHYTLYDKNDTTFLPYNSSDSSITWFFTKYPNGTFSKRIFDFVFNRDSNNKYESAYNSYYLWELLKSRDLKFPVSDFCLTIAVRNLWLVESMGLVKDRKEYLDEWMNVIESTNIILYRQVEVIKKRFESYGGF